MPDCTGGVQVQAAEINALNFKALYDDTQSDVSFNRKSIFRHQDAWETLRLRNAQFAASFDHALLASIAASNQTGQTENQQTVSPIRTATGDTLSAAAYPANRTVDTATAAEAVAAAGVATANQAVADALAQFIALMNQGAAALQAALVASAKPA
jgi:hypothetical protein